MKRFLTVLAAFALMTGFAKAGGITAQESAEASARECRLAHRGGSYRYEGVGFSTRSAGDAIKRCCFHGVRKAVEVGVAKGANGWYACVRYK
mgnify:CR=1 FL=1